MTIAVDVVVRVNLDVADDFVWETGDQIIQLIEDQKKLDVETIEAIESVLNVIAYRADGTIESLSEK